MKEAAFIHHPGGAGYQFNDHHPFSPRRLHLTQDLLMRSNALSSSSIIIPPKADDSCLLSVHHMDYITAVKALSAHEPGKHATDEAERYGLQSEDTPYFPGMHDAASCIAGGSVYAAELVMNGRFEHAYHMAGGLHHAFPDRGAGFCVYNDAALAIAYARNSYGARVMYIDTDVHHGDGVQWAFYNDPNVFTYSIHETGKYLFPGTGFTHERGAPDGYGCCLNVPVEPYTEDDSWLECFVETVERAAARFKPDIIVSQHGCDAHAYDPLSHISCSMRIYHEMPAVIHRLAHQYCEGRWVALGGGGYDHFRVVPRAWALVWLEMTGSPIVEALRLGGGEALKLPDSWVERWQHESDVPLPATWLDDLRSWAAMPRRAQITEANRRVKELALQQL